MAEFRLTLHTETISELNTFNYPRLDPNNDTSDLALFAGDDEDDEELDFDFPTINDHCLFTGTGTFGPLCDWCGFFHSTDW